MSKSASAPAVSAMTRKAFSRVELKADEPGAFRAYIATLKVVDKEGDVSLPGSFPDGKRILISAYQHTSWYGALPVGAGVLASDEKEAWVDGKFWLETDAGKQTYLAVKNAAELQEWSYGYDVLRASFDKADLDQYPGAFRVLVEQDVFEASPVLVGAGVNTRTESIKSAKQVLAGALPAKARALSARLKGGTLDPETMAAIAQIDFLADELDELVDTVMDQLGIPDPDEVAEGEPEEPQEPPMTLNLASHSVHALAAVKAFLQRVKARASMRTKDGRVLSSANRERLATLAEGLTSALADIQELLTATDPEAGKSVSDEELRRILLETEQRQTLISAGRL